MAVWNSTTQTALGISLALAMLVFLARAATPPAELTGGLITAVLTLAPLSSVGTSSWSRSGLPALVALFLFTWAATRFGRGKKQRLGVGEDNCGRNSFQVAANLGVAGLGAAIALSHSQAAAWCAVMVVAALAEAIVDTLTSELGEVLGGPPRLITNPRRVSPGTNGAISFTGTVAGTGGAVLVVMVAVSTIGLGIADAVAAGVGAVAGLFVDSLLGATVERRGVYGDAKATAFIAAMKKAHPEKNIRLLSYGVNGLIQRYNVQRMVKLKYDQGGAPVYQYSFTWQSPMLDGVAGAWHTSELAFCFDNTKRCEQGTGNTPQAQALAKMMSTAWVNFAVLEIQASRASPGRRATRPLAKLWCSTTTVAWSTTLTATCAGSC